MNMIIYLLIRVLDIYLWLIIAGVVISWLIVFDVLNTRNRGVYKICDFINRVTNPLYAQLRRVIPPIGGMDFTPMVAMLGIYLLQGFLYGLLR